MGDMFVEIGAFKTIISRHQLISLIKKHRVIWDKQHPKYTHKKTKTATWKQICKEITTEWDTLDGLTRTRLAAEIIRKWQNIRDAYVKYIKTSMIRPTKPYLFSSMLTFLNPYIEIERKSDISKVKSETLDDQNFLILEQNFKEDIEELETENTMHSNNSYIENESQDFNETLNDDTIVKVLANIIQRDDDEDKAFFNSLTSQVKLLSNDSKIQFRIEILKLLQNLLQKDKNDSENVFIEERLDSDSDEEKISIQ